MRAETPQAWPGIAWLPLGIGLVILVGMTVLPNLATHADGRADHLAATLLCAAMSAGFVRGVGFIPHHWLPRLTLSGPASFLYLLAAFSRLAGAPYLPLPL